ncbi:MAG: phosphoribosylformylglycinamidine synthase subunit PurQ [Planctomycetes bacterium]|nr:phosphoribosylformylglycinamidine synthase subunit PurQ [Planctomycetota bacterium]
MKPEALVLRAAGTNCEGEAVHALGLAGFAPTLLHVNQLLAEPRALDRMQLIVFPGGFTFGDDVASGAVFAYTLERRLHDQLASYVESGRLVIGICNGFQILVRCGILPGGAGRAALVENLMGRFEDRWVRMRAGARPRGPWLRPRAEYMLPVAHAEGRFEWFPDTAGAPFPEEQVALAYIGDGAPASYPANPNGAFQDIAGITNPRGNVFGLMPHPERFVQPTHHPFWMRYRRAGGSPPAARDLPVPLGLEIFQNACASLQ